MNMSKLGVVLGSVATAVLLAMPASARTITNAKISEIRVGYFAESKVAVTVTGGSSSGSIGCTPASGFNNTFIFDTAQGSGRSTLTVLLAAYLAGKNVDMVGASQCVDFIGVGFAAPNTRRAEELGHAAVRN